MLAKMTNMKTLFLVPLVLLFTACSSGQEEQEMQETETPQVTQAVAVIHPAEGQEVNGTVTFSKEKNGIRVHAELSGLSAGKHGFHIHTYGDCSTPDLSSAGGHYNPNNNDHGAPTDQNRHMGDMGNVEAGDNGNATLDYIDNHIKLNGPNNVIGRAIIVHQGEDDLTSQPSGNAGPRIGCGVIGIGNPNM